MPTKALIVDDSPIIRRVISMVLTSQKIASKEASDGKIALSMLKQDASFDLLLVDWSMPNMNGPDFISAVKRDSSYRHMKLFIVTANDKLVSAETARRIGADDYLIKPINGEKLADMLRRHGLN